MILVLGQERLVIIHSSIEEIAVCEINIFIIGRFFFRYK